jgi:hypothetical protein
MRRLTTLDCQRGSQQQQQQQQVNVPLQQQRKQTSSSRDWCQLQMADHPGKQQSSMLL